MSFYGKVAIVVTGCNGLEKTAAWIQKHFESTNQDTPIHHFDFWRQVQNIQSLEKPYILILKESELVSEEISNIHPDVIVVKNLSQHSEKLQESYLKLYSGVGPHVNTVFNAEDRSSIELAKKAQIRKGRIFYYSKNKALSEQIKNIGGVVSQSDEIEIHGFNLKSEVVKLQPKEIMAFEDEMALLASLGAVLTVGLDEKSLNTVF